MFPITAADVVAASACDSCFDDGSCSELECENELGCLWCESENCEKACPCVPASQGCSGYSQGTYCQFDEQCGAGLHCSGNKGGFIWEQACCPIGKEWIPEFGTCGTELDDYEKYVEDQGWDGEFNITGPSEDEFVDGASDDICNPGQCVNGDSNCDGVPDKGCPTAGCQDAKDEICNYLDDDCDGSVDDGCQSFCNKCGDEPWYTLGLTNLCDEEECSELGPGCVFEKKWIGGSCTETIVPKNIKGVPEVCNGIDDDNDKLVDEECFDEEEDSGNFTQLLDIFMNYYEKECNSDDQCGVLSCKSGKGKSICCFPNEGVVAGKCEDPRVPVKGVCRESKECQTEYCSMPVEGFWDGIFSPIYKWLDKVGLHPGAGKCCPEGTDYDLETDECISGGTFSSLNDGVYCKEKKMKGLACQDEEGNCQYDDECKGGSYCVKDGAVPNRCCPKGYVWDGEHCIENKNNNCGSCGKKNGCTKQMCLSISPQCNFNEEHGECYTQITLGHEEGNCNSGELNCGASNEELHCSVYREYGVCCYPWEQQDPMTGRCTIVCENEFCDIDGDYYSSEIELRYGAHPVVEEDTPNLRLIVEECFNPFEYPRFTKLPGGWLVTIITDITGGIGNTIAAGLINLFEGEAKKSVILGRAKLAGVLTGAGYGLMDDVDFALTITTFVASIPVKMVQSVVRFFSRYNEEKEKNPAFEESLIEKYGDAEIDSSIRNDMFNRISQLGYEYYDWFYEYDDDQQSYCYKQIHTKSFTGGFFMGYVVEQVLLLGKVGGFLLKAGKGAGKLKLVMRIAGRTFNFIDNPIGYGVVTPVAKLLNDPMGKMKAKFAESQLKTILKTEKATLNAAEMTKLLAESKIWRGITFTQFKKIFKNFMNLKEGLAKLAANEEEAVRLANKFLQTEAGQKIMLNAWGKGGWKATSVFVLVQAMRSKGFKKISNVLKAADDSVLKRFGKELEEGLAAAAGKPHLKVSVLEKLFEHETLEYVLRMMKHGDSLQKHIDLIEFGVRWTELPKKAYDAIIASYEEFHMQLLKAKAANPGELAEMLSNTHIGARILYQGISEEGWSFAAMKLLAEEMNSGGLRAIANAMEELTDEELRLFGKQFSGMIDDFGEEAAGKLLKEATIHQAVQKLKITGTMAGILGEAVQQAQKTVKYFNAFSEKKIREMLSLFVDRAAKEGIGFSQKQVDAMARSMLKFDRKITGEIIENLRTLEKGGLYEVRRVLEFFEGSKVNFADYFFLELLSNKNMHRLPELQKMGFGIGTHLGPNGIHWNFFDKSVVFRGTDLIRETPELVMKNGMASNGADQSLFDSLLSTTKSAWIHGSKTPVVAEVFGNRVYLLYTKSGIDVNEKLYHDILTGAIKERNQYAKESIVAFYERIQKEVFVGYNTLEDGAYKGFVEFTTESAQKKLKSLNNLFQGLVDEANSMLAKPSKFADSTDEAIRTLARIGDLPPGPTNLFMKHITDYPYFENIKQTLKAKYGVEFVESGTLQGSKKAGYIVRDKIFIYGPDTLAADFMHELRHFYQDLQRNFALKLTEKDLDIAVKELGGMTREQIVKITGKMTDEQLGTFLKYTDEIDAYKYSIRNADTFGYPPSIVNQFLNDINDIIKYDFPKLFRQVK